ncbi:MAG: ATP-binding cassette domain-containing protein [Calditrichaeota bacterium]|nr:ATP-binding cassette domain-containing protein [Calditrichota bacterium]MCB9366442.1 ATP-binding cassette domain-containing protein [Calditrichota bacterium]
MTGAAVRVEGLGKTYRDASGTENVGCHDVTFQANYGAIFGVLGTNGAGKTTMLRMLATMLKPTSGAASIAGFDLSGDPQGVRRSIGFLSASTGIYGRLTAKEMLYYFAALHGFSKTDAAQRIADVAKLLDLDSFLDRRCEKLSTGQKQRVSIARTILHDPPVLIFDEPTSGLDILAASQIVSFMRRSRDQGKCVLLSTHVMREAELLCDEILLIHRGEVRDHGSVVELQQRHASTQLEVVFLRAIGEDSSAFLN